MRKFTTEEIQMLAKAERMMDAGEAPYVLTEGGRMMVDPLVMEELGLETGQTVSNQISLAIAEAQLAVLQAKIATSLE